MPDFITQLFTENLMPHGYCLAWRPGILWLHVVSDALIAVAYYSIPVALFYFVRHRRDLPFSWVFYLFCGFIFACGTTHAIEIVTMWKAAYQIEGLAKATTAAVSLATAIALIPLTPKALALRSPAELESANRRLESEIAQRIAAETELQEAYDKLEERVAERTAELARTTESLELEIAERRRREQERRRIDAEIQEAQRLDSLGVMAGGVAHDLNNLLTVISGRGELLRERLVEDQGALEDLTPILEAARTAATLSEQMLVYAGRSGERTEPIDLSEAINGFARLLSATVSRNAELRYRLDFSAPPIESSPSEVRQVVMNLVLNASEALAGEPGEITVTTGSTMLDSEPPASFEMSFLESERQPCVFVEVSDLAGGMDLQTQRRAFDPFFSTKFTGRGLGLAVVVGVVRSRHGAVRLDSGPGRGSTFRILFPAALGKTAVSDQAFGRKSSPSEGQTILVVDDDSAVRHLVQRILESEGYRVLTAPDGVEALAVLDERADDVALVFLDVTMPRMNGPQVLEAMLVRGLRIPVILSSGYDESQTKAASLSKQAAVFLHKPFLPADLLQLARERLHHGAA